MCVCVCVDPFGPICEKSVENEMRKNEKNEQADVLYDYKRRNKKHWPNHMNKHMDTFGHRKHLIATMKCANLKKQKHVSNKIEP